MLSINENLHLDIAQVNSLLPSEHKMQGSIWFHKIEPFDMLNLIYITGPHIWPIPKNL